MKVERKEWLAEGREEGETNRSFKDVERIVKVGILDEKKTCEVLGVEISEYRKYVESKN